MNRRSFLKSVIGTVCGLYASPLLLENDSIAALRHRGKVRYRGIDWSLSERPDWWYATQLFGKTSFRGQWFSIATLIDSTDAKEDKVLLYYMDAIARRFEFRIKGGNANELKQS